MQGFPDSAEQFEHEKKSAISTDSAKVFDAIRENPTVKAVLAELRHTCYHGVIEFGPGIEPGIFGGYAKFAEIKLDGEYILARDFEPKAIAVRIFDAMGALVWSKERDAA